MIPEKIPVESRSVQNLGYVPELHQLWVQYHSSSTVYIYFNVSETVFHHVRNGEYRATDGKYPSIGAALNHYVLKNHKNPSSYTKRQNWA